jgi:hypothetical protein
MLMLDMLALLLAALLGFTAHRAGTCAVKAVGEVVSTRRARMLVSFGKTVMWIMAITLPLSWVTAGMPPMLQGPSLLSVAGAFVFGVGAAINGGCAVSTVTRLGNGELGMLMTIAGVAAGIGVVELAWPGAAARDAGPVLDISGWRLLLGVAVLWVWALREGVKLWRGRDRTCGVLEAALHRRWRLSVAAAVIGVTNAVIALIAGHWAYTAALRDAIGRAMAVGTGPPLFAAGLFVALMAGVVASSVLRRNFRLRFPSGFGWLRHLAGGVFMGIGVVAIPGGNDALLLDAIPSLSPHALPAFAAMLAGITVGLALLRRSGGVPRIDCGGDICREEAAA